MRQTDRPIGLKRLNLPRLAGIPAIVATIAVFPALASAAPITATWNGGSSAWSNPVNWTFSTPPSPPTTTPNNTVTDQFDVFVDGGAGGNSSANIDTFTFINTLNVSVGDTVGINNNRDLVIQGGSVVNNGQINLNSTGSDTVLSFDSDATIGGTGEISIGTNTAGRIIGTGGTTLTNSAGHTIRGSGQFLSSPLNGAFDNQGTIRQEGAAALSIGMGTNTSINSGVIEATGAGGIKMGSGTYESAGGIFRATNGSVIGLGFQTTIRDATFETTGTGEIQSQQAGNAPRLSNATITAGSVFSQSNNNDSIVENNVTNHGEWRLNSAGTVTDITFDGTQSILGTGKFVMGDNGNNRLLSSAGATVTHTASHTVEGSGKILVDTFVNQGTIRQTGTAGLLIDPVLFQNDATMIAEGAGGLVFADGIIRNNTVIEALSGAQIVIDGGTRLEGGTLKTSGTAAVNILSQNSVFDGVTIDAGSRVVQGNNRDHAIEGGLVNNGEWQLNSGGTATDLSFEGGSQTISGTGRIVMSDSAGNRIRVQAPGQVLTNEAGHSIEGSGQVLAGTGGFLNRGSVRATGAAATLLLDAGADQWRNQGTLRAEGAAGLVIDGATFRQESGSARVVAGSRMSVGVGNYVQTGGATRINGDMVITGAALDVVVQGGRFEGGGRVDFNSGGIHDLNNSAGVLAAGDGGAGHLTVEDGNYVQGAAGAFEFQLFGATPGVTHDLLEIIDGDAILAGSLDVVVDAGFAATLQVGDMFEVVRVTDDNIDVGVNSLFDTLNVNIAGLGFSQLLQGDSLFIEVTGISVAEVPETGPLPLIAFGLAVFAFARRRSKI